MNIFGNALKYTPSGYIKIKLGSDQIPSISANDGKSKSMITLVISDSGLGISADYMANKLFQPFCQVRTRSFKFPEDG